METNQRSREQAIDQLVKLHLQMIAEEGKGEVVAILINGLPGYANLTNEQLEVAYNNFTWEKIVILEEPTVVKIG